MLCGRDMPMGSANPILGQMRGICLISRTDRSALADIIKNDGYGTIIMAAKERLTALRQHSVRQASEALQKSRYVESINGAVKKPDAIVKICVRTIL